MGQPMQATSSRITFPRTAAGITSEWLTEVLRHDGALGGARVVSADLSDLAVGFGQTSDTTRVQLTLDGTPGDDTPRSLVAKFATTDATRRSASAAAHLYENEIVFYRDVQSQLDIAVPRCLFAELDDSGEYFALLLEDCAQHSPGDETVGATVPQAHLAVSQLASLHGPFWGRSGDSGARPWQMLPYDRTVAAWPVMVDTFGELIPEEILNRRDDLINSWPSLHEWMGSEPTTFAHGDFRLDNLLFDDEPGSARPIVVLDWQAAHTGRAIRDFAYFVAHSMPTEERRASEQSLLREYLQGLAAHGVTYPWDEAWHDYRLAMLYLFSIVVWITGVNVNSNERALRRKRALVQRACTALLDVDALELLPSH